MARILCVLMVHPTGSRFRASSFHRERLETHAIPTLLTLRPCAPSHPRKGVARGEAARVEVGQASRHARRGVRAMRARRVRRGFRQLRKSGDGQRQDGARRRAPESGRPRPLRPNRYARRRGGTKGRGRAPTTSRLTVLLDLRQRVVQTQNRAGRPGRLVNLRQHRRRGETL